MHTSPVADRLTLRGSSFAVEGIVQIGYWRFWKRWTVAQIHDVLTHERQVPISEREVLYLVGVFLVLLRCTYPLRFAEHAAYFRRHGLFVAVDALRPEKGNRALYVIRELKFGLVLQVVPVLAADHSTLATRVLRPVDALGYRIRGVVSDEEVALCQAVAQVWPRAAHQTCHWHCLRDAAAPLLAADRALKKAVKRALQDPVSAVARTLARLSPEGPCTEVLATYTELIRTSLGRGEQATVRLRESAHRGSLGADRSVAAAEPAKRGHPLLAQLLAVVQRRRAFTTPYLRLYRQRGWLVELERRLDPPIVAGVPRPSSSQVQRRVKAFLAELQHHAGYHPHDAPVIAHISATLANRWPRLFACYAWPERYRTNNEVETFFGRLRTRQRQTTGHKATHDFILRYGEWAVFVDPQESFEQVLTRCQQFNQDDFARESGRFQHAQHRLRVLYRFRHHPRRCLATLEQAWADAMRRKSQNSLRG